MTQRQSFVSVFDMHFDGNHNTDIDLSDSQARNHKPAHTQYPRHSEEARQQHAYEAFKQDISDCIQLDERMEDEFFGRRQLSIGDLAETTDIVTAPITPHQAAMSADYEPDNYPSPYRFSGPVTDASNSDSYGLPTILDHFIQTHFEDEDGSIRDVGFVNSTAMMQDNISERAYASSQFAEISNVSTPELVQDDDSEDLDIVKNKEFSDDLSPGTSHFHKEAGIKLAASIDEKHVNSATFNETAHFSDDSFMPRESTIAREEKAPQSDSPQIKHERSFHPDKEDVFLPSTLEIFADPAYFPGYDLPYPDNSESTKTHFDQAVSRQAVHDLGEPRCLPLLVFGKPTDSSLIKRRTKQENNVVVPSQKLLTSVTYDQVPKHDMASFFRRDFSVDNKTPLPSVRISRKPNYGDSPCVKKRSARESFDLIELCDENARREYARKKARLDVPPTPTSARLPLTPRLTISSCFDGSPMATTLRGYPGQFEVHMPRTTYHMSKTTKHVFGNHLHANGEIINLDFMSDRYASKADLSDLPNYCTVIAHADWHHMVAEGARRTDEENKLRKEAHRECAAARLEGVSVGFYRYFAGHMTVEEYIEAKMCVCWEGCFCNKMCTHFGDLACPCSGDLVVGEEA